MCVHDCVLLSRSLSRRPEACVHEQKDYASVCQAGRCLLPAWDGGRNLANAFDWQQVSPVKANVGGPSSLDPGACFLKLCVAARDERRPRH